MKFYRYTIVEYAELGLDGEYCSPSLPNPSIHLSEYEIYKETPKGYWLTLARINMRYKWVSKDARKRFAYPTKKEAMVNFIKRTEKRLGILKWQKSVCEIALNMIKESKWTDQE